MTGPEGERYHGWWRVTEVEPPRLLQVEDGFSDDDGNPDPDLPVTVMRPELAEQAGGGTLLTMTSTFPSREAMEEVLSMGAEEGLTSAVGQIDALLAADPAPSDA